LTFRRRRAARRDVAAIPFGAVDSGDRLVDIDEPMSWLAAVFALPPTQRPTLVDGSDEVSGDGWDDRIHRVREAIESTGLRPGEAVAFPCQQTVGDVVLLLALFERGLSVALQSENDSAPHAPFWRGTVRWHEGLEFRATDTPTLRRDAAPRLFVHTSGSLDRAKLVVHDPVRVLANARAVVHRLGLARTDRISVPVPIWHMYGLGAALLPGLLAGATIDLIAQANALRVFERERRFAPTVAFVTPSFAAALLKARRTPRTRPYRFSVCAGDRIDPRTFQAWEECSGALVQLYGSTELGAVAAASPDLPPPLRAASVGPPLDGVECRVDAAGALQVRSAFAFLGYADASGEPLPASAWLMTGDRAQVEDGRIALLGRSDLAVNRDGRLMQLEDVERVLERLTGVERAVVVADGQGARGVGLVAFVVGDAAGDPDALRAALRSMLPEWAIPERLCPIDGMPVGPNGKLDRAALAALARAQRSQG
jgi:acyl-coenzyme A synthetase/AMP-(fatty) acid ligase